ncbi:hypothetical protein HMPREF0216_01792 [Clostridium celatum DSM 1785]|uniref:Uncharacterized protein n=1 Tax=Clostridium celatum DSM 1785 TaxID=545697 RepID=L1QG90_9CLOT|nr:hypothetical protein HMPREF0216_01792 [Clostridium celatum DSM 1785]
MIFLLLCYKLNTEWSDMFMKAKTRDKLVYIISIFMLIVFILGLLPTLI